jgi:hypothetical protein
MNIVKYRMVEKRLAPRRTKIEVPGWAGEKQPRRSGSHEQGWHCLPFIEGAQAGIEVFFPYDQELQVTSGPDGVRFDPEILIDPATGIRTPPFREFGGMYYTYQLLLDLKVADGMAVRSEPHPRYYTSAADDVPLAVPATLRTAWWPMIAFVVFKNPPPGVRHVFRPGEPFMQFVLLPAEIPFELVAMDADEAAERELQSQRIYASRAVLAAETTWTSSTDIVFDGTYRHILGAARAKGKAEDQA